MVKRIVLGITLCILSSQFAYGADCAAAPIPSIMVTSTRSSEPKSPHRTTLIDQIKEEALKAPINKDGILPLWEKITPKDKIALFRWAAMRNLAAAFACMCQLSKSPEDQSYIDYCEDGLPTSLMFAIDNINTLGKLYEVPTDPIKRYFLKNNRVISMKANDPSIDDPNNGKPLRYQAAIDHVTKQLRAALLNILQIIHLAIINGANPEKTLSFTTMSMSALSLLDTTDFGPIKTHNFKFLSKEVLIRCHFKVATALFEEISKNPHDKDYVRWLWEKTSVEERVRTLCWIQLTTITELCKFFVKLTKDKTELLMTYEGKSPIDVAIDRSDEKGDGESSEERGAENVRTILCAIDGLDEDIQLSYDALCQIIERHIKSEKNKQELKNILSRSPSRSSHREALGPALQLAISHSGLLQLPHDTPATPDTHHQTPKSAASTPARHLTPAPAVRSSLTGGSHSR